MYYMSNRIINPLPASYFLLQCYYVDKVHCVWKSDEELNVLFESKELPGPENLRTVRVQFVSNKEMVAEYLARTEYIPHIQTVITMVPTSTIQTNFSKQ